MVHPYFLLIFGLLFGLTRQADRIENLTPNDTTAASIPLFHARRNVGVIS